MVAKFMQTCNLYIIGPQCTGKTTLVNAVEADLAEGNWHTVQPTIIREVARIVLKEKQFTREDISTSPTRALQLQQHILDGQLAAEQMFSKVADPFAWYVCDRSGLDPIVYTSLFVGQDAAEEMLATKAWRKLEMKMKGSVVILCEAGCTWLTDDGTRLMPTGLEDWIRVDTAFRRFLEMRKISFVILSKDVTDIADRVSFVKDELRKKNHGCCR